MSSNKIYFLPGTMCDQRLWQQTFSQLPADIEPVYIDIPLAESFEQIIFQLALILPKEQVNLVGFSLGGYVASLFACLYPQRINKLLISANSPLALPLFELAQRKIAVSAISQFGYQGVPLIKIHSMLAKENMHNQEIVELIQAMDKTGGIDKLLSQLKATSQRTNLLPQLSELQIKTHFVHGDQDKLVNNALISAATTADNISHCVIDNCGHMCPLEAPQKLAEQITNFFGYV